jgi:hypothetical protein
MSGLIHRMPFGIELVTDNPKEENIVVRVQKPIKERLEQIAS